MGNEEWLAGVGSEGTGIRECGGIIETRPLYLGREGMTG